MKSWKYYLKSTDKLIAMTDIKTLADEFELVYDMSKFYKITEDWDDDKEYNKATGMYGKYKLWIYTLTTKGDDDENLKNKFNVCMTREMNEMIKKASRNIEYTLKTIFIACAKLKDTDGFAIKQEYLDAINELSYSIDPENNEYKKYPYGLGYRKHKKFTIDEYKIWLDVYNDIIAIKDDPDKAYDTAIAAARILGIYKYDWPEVIDKDDTSMYDVPMISMDIFGNRI